MDVCCGAWQPSTSFKVFIMEHAEVSLASPRKPGRRTGRTLSFDRDVALEQAMLVFWEHGYETTSAAETRHLGGSQHGESDQSRVGEELSTRNGQIRL